MSDYWDTYTGYIEDKLASVVLDMEISEEVDPEHFPYAFAVSVPIKLPNENGFPSETENEKMNGIEEAFTEHIQTKKILCAGRITSDGSRDIILYSSLKEVELINKACIQFFQSAGYEYEITEIEEEEPWAFYFTFLYPDPYQLQHMGNWQIVEMLEESGDSLDDPRHVDHWIYFEDKKMMKRFSKAIKKEGFEVEEEALEEEENVRYRLQISRTDLVDIDSINEITDFLVETAEKFEGDYDGWETMVIEQK
ncbi:DUF695 domain-containing protein [Jeotgalibacillus proteolyticus]|uniref:DUF695 domain-containing protein n=1 Tax=Jeotgalibacillus proteolyticus TaxID=2082395 RepID=A0A2S5G9Z4_9BACL|nr:DUF695 domain-containing protein [Jeotgalibacillus proteolyticus]PPA69741.1 DUF695 domain-containing protein [Jeotgalibacillus proteolyticus]